MHLGSVSSVFVSLPLREAAHRMHQLALNSIEIGTGGFLPKNHCDPAKLLADEFALTEFKGTLAESDPKISALAMHSEPLHPDLAISQAYCRDFRDTRGLAQKLRVVEKRCRGTRRARCRSGNCHGRIPFHLADCFWDWDLLRGSPGDQCKICLYDFSLHHSDRKSVV